MTGICAIFSTFAAASEANENLNDMDLSGKKVLVAYFSHTGENYAVGVIEKGNTHIIAEMIAEAVGGELFEIEPARRYPHSYNDCIAAARREKEAGARPAIAADIEAESYDVIFIGYPNWWGEVPMCVYTFLEKHDWSGKTVIPFCTHEGSGLSGTERSVAAACPGASVKKGLAVKGTTAQHEPARAREAVGAWLGKLQ